MIIMVFALLIKFWFSLPTLDTLTSHVFMAGMAVEIIIEFLLILALLKYLGGGK